MDSDALDREVETEAYEEVLEHYADPELQGEIPVKAWDWKPPEDDDGSSENAPPEHYDDEYDTFGIHSDELDDAEPFVEFALQDYGDGGGSSGAAGLPRGHGRVRRGTVRARTSRATPGGGRGEGRRDSRRENKRKALWGRRGTRTRRANEGGSGRPDARVGGHRRGRRPGKDDGGARAEAAASASGRGREETLPQAPLQNAQATRRPRRGGVERDRDRGIGGGGRSPRGPERSSAADSRRRRRRSRGGRPSLSTPRCATAPSSGRTESNPCAATSEATL